MTYHLNNTSQYCLIVPCMCLQVVFSFFNKQSLKKSQVAHQDYFRDNFLRTSIEI